MMGGRGSLGITESVENCGTVGVTEVMGSSVGSIELDEDSGTVVSAGVSVEVTGSGIIDLGEDSGTVVSTGVSMEVTGSADWLSLV